MGAELVLDFKAVIAPLPALASADREDVARIPVGMVPGRFGVGQVDSHPVLEAGLSMLEVEEEVRHEAKTGEPLIKLQKIDLNAWLTIFFCQKM